MDWNITLTVANFALEIALVWAVIHYDARQSKKEKQDAQETHYTVMESHRELHEKLSLILENQDQVKRIRSEEEE